MRSRTCGFLSALVLTLAAGLVSAAQERASGRLEDQAALKPYGSLVGKWRGTGQPERGRAKGAWQESASWAWKLGPDSAALEAAIEKGKYLKSARLRPGPRPKSYILDATLADGTTRTFTGESTDKPALVLTADDQGEGLRRITLTPLHDTRLLVKLEARDPKSRGYSSLGEVGYTREGVAFAAGETGPVCIVTEGRGTIPVSYKGKTYYVCCSGCRDLFREQPEEILAEAAEREKAKGSK